MECPHCGKKLVKLLYNYQTNETIYKCRGCGYRKAVKEEVSS